MNSTRLLLALVLLAQAASASTFFVDYLDGDDSANGTTTATAWKRCPGDPSATGVSDGTSLAPGDTVVFKGGSQYSGNVALPFSGSAEAVITYDGSGSSWGTGKAIVDANYQLGSYCFAANTGIGHIEFKGFHLRNAGGWADDDAAVVSAAAGTVTNSTARDGNGLMFYAGGHTNIRIADLFIERMGGWRNTQGWTAGTIAGSGIALKNCNGVVVTNCEMTKMKAGIVIYATTEMQNVTVQNCDIHNYIVWGVDIAPQLSGATIRNVEVKDTRVRDYVEFTSGVWAGVGEWPHTDGIFVRTAAIASVWTNVSISGCSFYCDSPGSSDGGTAAIFVSQGASVSIFNNLFQDTQTRQIGVDHSNPDASVQVVRIYNNTFLTDGSPAIVMGGETNAARRQVYIQNNIFAMAPGAAQNWPMITRLSGVEPVVQDYNRYYDPDWSAGDKYVAAIPGYSSLATIQGLGWDTNSTYGSPLFVDSSAVKSERNLRLQSALEGTDLSAFFTDDFTGATRVAPWDIGAYEYLGRSATAGTVNVGTLIITP